ncbi:MAG TPA: hypothetical protein VI521_03065 [Candidatus Babeliales bacterium]|nr:hypothetical protein [Candidatus Babeliales bacterium]
MNNSQFVLSYELLVLLRWLIDHDEDKIKKIIGNALKSGLQEELQLLDNTENISELSELQHSITDFLGTMEALLIETASAHIKEKARQQKLLPSVDQIDTTLCDDTTVRFSVEKATSELAENPGANAKELLFSEILKRWQPADKNLKH